MSEIHELEYAIWQLDQETCQIHLDAEIEFQFEFAFFISRADYGNEDWNQHSMGEFNDPLMKKKINGWMGMMV